MALHTAARWYIALHHGLLPYLVPAGLTCVYSWWTSFYALTTPGPDVPLWRLLVNAVLLPVAAAAVLTGRCPRGAPILVQLPGGTLEVCVQRDDTVLLTGDAAATFSGTVLIQPCKAPRGVV